MRGADIGSSQHSPPAAIPEAGQVSEESSESANKERWAVLHEDEAGSNLAHDTRELAPEAGAGAVEAGAASDLADVLAREAARHHVNTAAPRSSVKGANVIPNREGREKSVVLSGDKYACGVGVNLDSADDSPAEPVACEQAATNAREQSQLIHAQARAAFAFTERANSRPAASAWSMRVCPAAS